MPDLSRSDTSPELLVSISLRFPNVGAEALTEHIAPLVQAALAAGGRSTNVSIQPFDPDEEDED